VTGPASPWWRGGRAWLLAAVAALLGVAGCSATGVLADLGRPLAWRDGTWQLLTAAWTLQVVVAYPVVWARGTWTLGRPRDPLAHTAFGLLWAAAEVGLLLTGWALLSRLDLPPPAAWAVAFVALSAAQGAWHALLWDVHVSPEHNDPAWNLRKVVLCHVPNLGLGLAHLERFGEPGVALALWSTALVVSAHAMRFPRPSWHGPAGTRPGQSPSRSAVSTTRRDDRTTASSTMRPRSSTTTPAPDASDAS
jgi:hypothetical protein